MAMKNIFRRLSSRRRTPLPPPILSVADGTGSASQTIQVDIELEQIFDGISGFVIDATVADPAIARIESVTLPVYGIELVVGAPGPSVTIVVADAEGVVDGQVSLIVIATLDVQLLSAGSTQITLTVDQLDSDTGQDLIPGAMLNPGTITVN